MRILVIEDEEKVARFLRKGLESEGYEVETASDGKSGERKALTEDFDLVVLDVLLPKKSGWEVLHGLRSSRYQVPVLMLTALSSKQDIVKGLDQGADDYLPKPFVFDEFLARIRSLLRRSQSSKTVLKVGDLRLDTVSRKASRNGRTIDLTSREFALLEFLMRNHSKPIERQQLAKEIWGYSFDPGTNVVDVYVNHLRKKIEHENAAKLLYTVRGKGYMLTLKKEGKAK
jgi:DNA-binding response OmpR family regulator